MTTLSSILQSKSSTFYAEVQATVDPQTLNFPENNIDLYTSIDVYSACGISGCAPQVNWTAPGNGIVVIDAWGSSGSGGRMCCCGIGIPGNPGAYARKVLNVQTGDTITGIVGISCGNASSLCYRGRGTATCLTINTTANGCECICAQGGFGGTTYCTSSSPFCTFFGGGFCGTLIGSSCGIICNLAGTSSATDAVAYGGDINKNGGISCVCFFCNGVSSAAGCATYQMLAISPGIVSTNNSRLEITTSGNDNSITTSSNSGYYELMAALNHLSRSFSPNNKFAACWTGARYCGCYEFLGCQITLPVGVPAPGMTVSDGSTRDSGLRGGPGMVKIKFIGS